MIPGYIGGRCVKWLRRIWISDKENDSYWQFHDNRNLPSFVTGLDGDFAHVTTHHPDTAIFEQNLNSVICKPKHRKRIYIKDSRRGQTYHVEGYAYDGAGHEVQRVEISLDERANVALLCTQVPSSIHTTLQQVLDLDILAY